VDPFTHTMAGAVISRAGGDQRTPLATATLMLAANAPDIDIVTVWTATSFGSIAFRRGWTHGPIALAMLPLVITIAILTWDRFVRLRRNPTKAPVDPHWTLVLAIVGVLSHPLLDWLNTYGIRLLMPFSERWFYGDSVFIVDPYWWVLLATTLILARRRRPRRAVRMFAALALAYPMTMVALAIAGDRLAVRAAREQGISSVREVLYQPRPLSPHRAQLIAVTADRYLFGEFQWLGNPRVAYGGPSLARGDWSDPRVAEAQQDPDVRDYLVWSRYPWVRIDSTATTGTVTVVFGDARFPEGGLARGLGGLRVAVPAR
jgi:inner membrane protein